MWAQGRSSPREAGRPGECAAFTRHENRPARRFFFDNAMWTAEEALEHGAVDMVVPDDALIDTALDLAERWGAWGPHVREATKHLLHVTHDHDLEAHLAHERTLIEAAATTEAFEEGVAAFIARRSKT